MFSSLSGLVEHVSGNIVTLDVHGVGYEVHCTSRCVDKLEIGRGSKIIIYTDVKQDDIKLYGFEDRLEKHVFLLLTQVKGLGAKSASDVISRVEKRELLRLIASGDSGKLQAVRGIGKKTAERIIVELKDKVAEYVLDSRDSGVSGGATVPIDDAVAALQALGFQKKMRRRPSNRQSKHWTSRLLDREKLFARHFDLYSVTTWAKLIIKRISWIVELLLLPSFILG